MNCGNCNSILPEGAKHCPNCGAPVAQPVESAQPVQPVVEPVQPVQPNYAQQQAAYAQPAQPVQPNYAQPQAAYAQAAPTAEVPGTTKILVFGIVGLACGLSWIASIVGIVFSALCLSQAGTFISTYGNISGKVRTGRGLAIGGLIVSIVMTVFLLIYIFAVGCAACMYW